MQKIIQTGKKTLFLMKWTREFDKKIAPSKEIWTEVEREDMKPREFKMAGKRGIRDDDEIASRGDRPKIIIEINFFKKKYLYMQRQLNESCPGCCFSCIYPVQH